MKKAIALLLLVTAAACIPCPHTEDQVAVGKEIEFQHALVLKKERKYTEAVKSLRKISRQSPTSSVSASALYELACIRTYYDNPQRDYAHALSLFEEFLQRYPDDVKAADAENWRFVLRTTLDTKKENERLKTSIEELKQLDIRHEERRRK